MLKKRILSLFLLLVMVFSCFPGNAYASSKKHAKDTQAKTETTQTNTEKQNKKSKKKTDIKEDKKEEAPEVEKPFVSLADIYLKNKVLGNPYEGLQIKSIAEIAENELKAADNTEKPLGSDCIKYNTWLYDGPMSNKYENGKYQEEHSWNTAFVSWCANNASLIRLGCFPKARTGAELHAWFASDISKRIPKAIFTKDGSDIIPERDDLLFFPFRDDFKVAIVTSCENNVVTYIMGDANYSVKEFKSSFTGLPADTELIRWRTEYDQLRFFVDYLCNEIGFTKTAACGVLANMKCESGFNPHAIGDEGTSFGLCQWHNGRWDTLVEVCYKNGLDWTSIDGQLFFLKYELTTYRSLLTLVDRMNACGETQEGAYEAAALFCEIFERPADIEKGSERRGNIAAYTYYQAIVENGHG